MIKNAFGSAIIGVSIIITALILSGAWVKGKQNNESVYVIGSASNDFVSDLIVWRGSFSRKAFSIKEAYGMMKTDAENIKKYLTGKGVSEKDIVFSSVEIQKNFRQEMINDRQSREVFDGYTLLQSITIESKDVDKVEKISREITELIDLGIELNSQMPEYFYTKLSALKIEMLAKATADAKLRAEKIAENAGGDLGKLKDANMGIFQITGQNTSEDYSYGGAYNTNAKNKTASITVRLQYGID
ncbi:MAG: SIMPL domain-containing protein [Sphingobacteriales bacterium]|nr:MAG: SIMPL domain-containing protein [Sphingobacteriales bacterium]